jgi:hypothetical protein
MQTLVSKLTKKEKKLLLRFIARISESSYRRGVHQTLYLFSEEELPVILIKDVGGHFRYGTSLDNSKGLTDNIKMSSVDRLIQQYDLHSTGLEEVYENN